MGWNVTAAFDKTSYVAGETITMTISGDFVHTVETAGEAGPLTVPLVALATGAKSTIVVPVVPVTIMTDVSDDVVIDPSVPIIDASATPRVWTLSADGKSIAAVA